MAWISIFDTMRDHPKTRRLAQELKINRHEAIGVLVCLWTWGLDNADRDGVILNATAEDIADGIMSRGLSADKLLDGLIKAGWIDRIGTSLKLHDWDEWQAEWYKYKERKKADADRKRIARAHKNSTDCPLDSPVDSLKEIRDSPSPSPSPSPIPSPKNQKNESMDAAAASSAKKQRRKYGTYGWVKLSDDEYSRLLNDLGQTEFERCIQYVDECAQATGNKNKWRDWNLVIRRCSNHGWGRDRSYAKGGTSNGPGVNQHDTRDWTKGFHE